MVWCWKLALAQAGCSTLHVYQLVSKSSMASTTLLQEANIYLNSTTLGVQLCFKCRCLWGWLAQGSWGNCLLHSQVLQMQNACCPRYCCTGVLGLDVNVKNPSRIQKTLLSIHWYLSDIPLLCKLISKLKENNSILVRLWRGKRLRNPTFLESSRSLYDKYLCIVT